MLESECVDRKSIRSWRRFQPRIAHQRSHEGVARMKRARHVSAALDTHRVRKRWRRELFPVELHGSYRRLDSTTAIAFSASAATVVGAFISVAAPSSRATLKAGRAAGSAISASDRTVLTL